MVYKLRKLRRVIKGWSKENFYSIKETKNKLSDELLGFETMEEDGELSDDEKVQNTGVDSLNNILTEEEIMWRIRSRELV